MSDDAIFLKEQARRCRRLAELWHESDLKEALLTLASEYEARAEEPDRGPEQKED